MSTKDPIEHLSKDRKLAKIIKKIGNYEIRVTKNKYESQ